MPHNFTTDRVPDPNWRLNWSEMVGHALRHTDDEIDDEVELQPWQSFHPEPPTCQSEACRVESPVFPPSLCAESSVEDCVPPTENYVRFVPINQAIDLLEQNQPDKDKDRYIIKNYCYDFTNNGLCSKLGFSKDEAICCKHCGVNLRKKAFESFPVFTAIKEDIEKSLSFALSGEDLTKRKLVQFRMKSHSDDGKEFWLAKIKGDLVCPDCANKEYAYCSVCRYLYLTKDIESYEGISICHKCKESYITCNGCGKSRIPDQHCGVIDVDNNIIELLCPECRNNYIICANCGNASTNKVLFVPHGFDYNPNPDRYLCLVCDAAELSVPIHDYSYKPTPTFYSGKNEHKTKLYFGIELEVEAPNISADEVDNKAIALPKQLFAKFDSSIEFGFEIVTNPMTFKYMRENSEIFERILAWRKEGWKSYNTSTCGMHIHLSKDAFTRLQLWKFMTFFNKHQDLIYKISQRKSKGNLRTWASFEEDDGHSIIYKAKNKEGGFERHVAVNLTNKYTVEIRVFKGTLNPISFWKNIEFCHALWVFTGNSSIKTISPKRFELFMKQHRKDYPNLYNFWFSKVYSDFCKGD